MSAACLAGAEGPDAVTALSQEAERTCTTLPPPCPPPPSSSNQARAGAPHSLLLPFLLPQAATSPPSLALSPRSPDPHAVPFPTCGRGARVGHGDTHDASGPASGFPHPAALLS